MTTRQQLNYPFRISLLMIMVLLVGLQQTQSSTLFKIYPLADDYFQRIYMIQDHGKKYFLTISCKEQNMLSISITETRLFEEAPRFNIHGNLQNKPKMASQSYTFLRQCNLEVEVNKNNYIQVKRNENTKPIFTINNVTFSDLHNMFKVNDESIKWGLGERFQSKFRVTDGKWTIWNRDKPWKVDRGVSGLSDQTYGHQPIYLARQKQSKFYHLVYFKNTFGMLIQATKDADQLLYHSVGGNIHFIIIAGKDDPEAVLEQYHSFIGQSMIPPFWSLGYHQCRWGYKTIQTLNEVLSKFKENDLPIDTIWSDLDYMDRKMIFTVNTVTHGNGQLNKMMKDHQVNFIPLLDVGVSINDHNATEMGTQMDVFLHSPHKPQDLYLAQVWPGTVHFVDYLHPQASTFWKRQLKRLYDQVQFSGIWLDMNEPSNFKGNERTTEPFRIQQNEGINQMTINVDIKHYSSSKTPLYQRQVHAYFGHLSTVPTNEFFKEQGRRPFIISRSNSVGSGHFAGHWTGDNVANWQFLRLSINGNFLYQIFGFPMVGADICGFNEDTTQELCSRWYQVAAFYPFSRNHNVDNARSQEPYAFGSKLLQTSRKSLKTRYALLKYMYTIMLAKKGKGSFYRPLNFEFPNDQQVYQEQTIQTQFLIGKGLMGAPIVYKEATDRNVYFPGSQDWFQFQIDIEGKVSKESVVKYSSNKLQKIKNPLPSPPLTFLRAGHAILTNQPENRSAKLSNQFHLFAPLFQSTSTTQILAIKDYNIQKDISICIEQDCLIKVTLRHEKVNEFNLQWKYQGNKEIRSEIEIASIIAVDGENKWKYDQSIKIDSDEGKKTLTLEVL